MLSTINGNAQTPAMYAQQISFRPSQAYLIPFQLISSQGSRLSNIRTAAERASLGQIFQQREHLVQSCHCEDGAGAGHLQRLPKQKHRPVASPRRNNDLYHSRESEWRPIQCCHYGLHAVAARLPTASASTSTTATNSTSVTASTSSGNRQSTAADI